MHTSDMTHAVIDTIIDIEYNKDLTELKKEFATVDISRNSELRAWFAKHPYLTTNDMMRIANICLKTVCVWRHRIGWKPAVLNKNLVVPKPPLRKSAIPTAPPDWDVAWLIKMYQDGYSLPQLARSVSRSIFLIKRTLKRHIKLRDVKDSVRSTHPCRTLQWVFEHYVNQCLSQKQCARLAGVSRYTFSTWLNFFKIRVRSHTEQTLVNNGTDLGKRLSTGAKKPRHGE